MDAVPEKISFPETEAEILDLWTKLDAFQTSLKKSEGKPEFSFYDGPPFATGLPHYGHILAGTIKDTVTRYAHQTGHHVIRRFGWDCHGLPIEFEIDKLHGVKTREDVLAMGIPKYNAECRSIVMKYSGEWERIVTRLGRWIDFKNDYKTLDKNFMESVWWVFSKIYEMDYVYKGFKVMPYSTACTTPLSNFEAGQAYKDVQDPAVSVSFQLVDEDASMIAWTTTPWTLPSNLALVVNPEIDYVKILVKETGKLYIMAEKRVPDLFKTADLYVVKEKYKGKDLKGKRYVPLFPYFAKEAEKGAFTVLADGYVTEDSGTGVVHSAPAFGEEDFRVSSAAGIVQKGEDIVCPVDANGRFTSEVTDFAGMYVKDADKEIIKYLKTSGNLVHQSTIFHSYPFCWRSDTPLIYKAVPSWFVAVERIRDKLLKNNKNSYWVPEYVQEKRFHNWLQDARDWAISRNRYWGTPIPIWISDDGLEKEVMDSVEKLEKLSGVKVTDLHRESIDHITIPSKRGPQFGVLKRIEEVFDCWFESGSMPYAQLHYPFENKKRFEENFPADFIAEGIDQTRGWFYTLLVISTILFDKAPFKNLIVNGLVLASDGKKMSKRLKNYPDPMEIVHLYGADALRLYLITSPVVRGETLKFQEAGVRDMVKDVFLPWFNAYRFLVEAVRKFDKVPGHTAFKPDIKLALHSENIMDKWILAAVNSLIKFVRKEMEAYRLYTVVPQLVKFIEQLTNWYVRLNRRRLKGAGGQEDCRTALATLFEVVYTLTKAMAPFTPFLTEYFYQNLRKILPESEREDCVHYLMFPTPVEEAINVRIEEAIGRMQAVIQLGRQARDRKTLPLKFPLTRVTSINKNDQFQKDVDSLRSYIVEELNVKELAFSSDDARIVNNVKVEHQLLGKRLRKDLGKVQKAIQALTQEQIKSFQEKQSIEIEGYTITGEELRIAREFKGDASKFEAAWDSDDVLIVLDLEVDELMRQEGLAREIINRVQRLRKKAGIHPSDPIEVFYDLEEKNPLITVVESQRNFIHNGIGVPFTPIKFKSPSSKTILAEKVEVVDSSIYLDICWRAFTFNEEALKTLTLNNNEALKTQIGSQDYAKLSEQFKAQNGKVQFNVNGSSVEVELGKHVFSSAHDLFSQSTSSNNNNTGKQ